MKKFWEIFHLSYDWGLKWNDLKYNTPATLITDYPVVWTVKSSVVGTRVLAAL